MDLLNGSTVLTPADGVVVEALDDGAVVWAPAKASLHQLDAVGSAVWHQLAPARPLSEVFAGLALQFGAEPAVVRRDAMPFLADLVLQELLTVRS